MTTTRDARTRCLLIRSLARENAKESGTFRRTHTGDHQCKREKVLSMLRDSDTSSQDAAIAENGRLEFINRETVHRYRMRFDQRNENHVWSSADDDAFLTNIGALRTDENGVLKPTRAGLLMFGEDRWIMNGPDADPAAAHTDLRALRRCA